MVSKTEEILRSRSCSNLGDAQARRLRIRVNGKDGKKYLAHTLNNTVVAPPRMLIAFLENNLNADGSVNIPEALQPYMGGMKRIEKKDPRIRIWRCTFAQLFKSSRFFRNKETCGDERNPAGCDSKLR